MAILTKNKPHVKMSLPPPVVKPYQRPGTIPNTVAPIKAKTVYVRKDYLTSHDRKPIVFYTLKAWDTVEYLVKHCSTELGWVGAVEQINQFEYIVHDVRVMDQEAGAATFDYDDWNLPVTEMIMKGTMRTGFVDANLGHSHVNMGVTPSGTDEEQMMDLMHPDDNGEPTSKFSIQTIHNKKGDYTCAVYDWENNVHYPKCDIKIISSLNEEDILDLQEQLKRVKSYTYSAYNYNAGYGLAKQQDVAVLPIYDPYDVDTPSQELALDGDDYEQFMDDWDQIAWAAWQSGDPLPDIQDSFIKRTGGGIQ